MTGPDKQLAALRAEIDAIDSQLHDLLMRRTDLAVQVGEVKARVQPLGGTPADGSKFIRPAREALILRRLVARHQGKLPKAVKRRVRFSAPIGIPAPATRIAPESEVPI
jgi:chorismate mutase/prephenate dehydratase